MKLLLSLLAFSLIGACSRDERSAEAEACLTVDGKKCEILDAFDADADADADVDAALRQAGRHNTRVLLVLGGNWCPDARGLAGRLAQPEVAPLVAAAYELVYVDIGRHERNLHIPARFGLEQIEGAPIVLIISPEGSLLNPDSTDAWRTASKRSADEVARYFAEEAETTPLLSSAAP